MIHNLYDSVRHKYNLKDSDKNFLNKKEMESIVNAITGEKQEWTNNGTYMKDYLANHGWLNQKTIDSHPNTINLNWLLEHDRETNENDYSKVTLTFLLEQMSTEFLSRIKSVNLEDRTLTIKF